MSNTCGIVCRKNKNFNTQHLEGVQKYNIGKKLQSDLLERIVNHFEVFYQCCISGHPLKQLIDKLDDLGISHNDIFSRNIIIIFNKDKRSIKNVAIIDFGMVTFNKKYKNTIDPTIYFFKQDLLTSLPDLYN